MEPNPESFLHLFFILDVGFAAHFYLFVWL